MRLQPLALTLAISLAYGAPAPAVAATEQQPSTAAAPAAAAKATKLGTVEGITEYKLPNGMRILLAPDDSKPTTTVNITYQVGSRHENYGETGMAHLLEHMVFKETANRGPIFQELGKRGMDFNGRTFMDHTDYFETFAASEENLAWALSMEADRMVNSVIAKTELDKEFSVVRNEMERDENDPRRVLWRQLAAVTYDWHNYGKSTIGARSDVENVKIDNLHAFYRKYYQPDNAVLVVTGKFDPAKTLALIEKNFGPIAKPARVLEPTYTQDAPRDGARELTVKRVSDTQLVAALYPTAAGAHADSAAVAALGEILGNTPNGRLHKSMVEAKKAVGTETWNLELAEPGYIVFWAELSKAQSMGDARKLLLEQIEGFARKPVTEAELARAKAAMLARMDKTINDAQRLAVQLSESICKGDWRLLFLRRDRIEALTVADVQAAAVNYFKETNRTFGQFVPIKEVDRTVIPATPDAAKLVADYKGRAAVAEGEVFDVSPANIDQRTVRSTLPNGMKLALVPKKTRANAVNGHIVLEFGDEKSLFGHLADADMASDMLLRGAGKLSRADISTQLDQLKAKVRITQTGQTVDIHFNTVRKNLPQLLGLLKDVLRAPTFPQAEFEQLRSENVTQLEADRNEPQAIGPRVLDAAFNQYKKGDIRYRGTLDEMVQMYQQAKLADVKKFYDTMYGGNNGSVSLVGDFDAAEVQEQFKAMFGNWNSKAKYVRLPNPAPAAKAGVQQLETVDKANAFYTAALPIAMQDNASDYAAMLVVNRVLGDDTQSRLNVRLRQQDGLSYGVGSQFKASAFEPNGQVVLYAIYAPQNLDKLKRGFNEELTRMLTDGMTEQELTDAKNGLMQQHQTTRAQDGAMAAVQTYNLRANRTMAYYGNVDAAIQALTLDQVNGVLRKYIDPSKLYHVYAGDFATAAKKAAVGGAAPVAGK
ncbi:pitrilysin family protein [Pseudoduganella ginsengisoli]|uniref:Insulinase family protein n=1 Tax=Pseudoduganella ginsengisoli TaxID=1462440 RepID=A0A6L6PYI5_9BURK|nr:pitrilysin family protein [Pseudoduganella ginsengisoli]MTW01752.1 insulinase family protein [Pseudoduganella ginsengisoli]